MSHTPADLPFLQHLYAQDTLYLIPEEQPLADSPVPSTAAVVAPEQQVQVSPVVKEEIAAPAVADVPAIEWLGEALKGTYLLFDVPKNVFPQLPNHPFLQKVLAAVGLASLEVKFGNLSNQLTHNVKVIAREQQARHILVFGEHLPIENLLKLEPYRMYKLDETRFVRIDSLSDIEQSNELKKKLWDVLQKIFLQ
ncbi:hypothetical protein [Rufibacter roseus]|uniref:DNA polymerase III subunit psi n=1 Tax=Rufibacter roseus TaxID=1567108 RepID=A0ABW2DPR1_9BACT|nr:hypothetical protein [Rufibacter roseus]